MKRRAPNFPLLDRYLVAAGTVFGLNPTSRPSPRPALCHCAPSPRECRCTSGAWGPHAFHHTCAQPVVRTDFSPIEGPRWGWLLGPSASTLLWPVSPWPRPVDAGTSWGPFQSHHKPTSRLTPLPRRNDRPVHDVLAVHHYATRSREEFEIKMSRGSGMKRQRWAGGSVGAAGAVQAWGRGMECHSWGGAAVHGASWLEMSCFWSASAGEGQGAGAWGQCPSDGLPAAGCLPVRWTPVAYGTARLIVILKPRLPACLPVVCAGAGSTLTLWTAGQLRLTLTG